MSKNNRIFLDYAAGRDNPSAIHAEGRAAKKKLEEARIKIARILHVQARDIIFTSGGTESDNLALLGVSTPDSHIVISSIEHSAILESAKEIEHRDGEVTIVEAEDGVVEAEKVLKAVKENTVLVSIIYANNETGAIQPISKITRLIKNVLVHTDASQAIGYLPLDVSALGVDLMTLDGSKVGVRGVGVLVARPGVKIRPIIFGGDQERSLRAGTENVEAISQFAGALEKAEKNRDKESIRLTKLKEIFLAGIHKNLPKAVINTPERSLPNIISVSFPGELHEFLAIKLDERGLSCSTGSSCRSGSKDKEGEALRFSFGAKTTKEEIEKSIRILTEVML